MHCCVMSNVCTKFSHSIIHSLSRRNMLSIRLDRRARRLESNNRERRRMHELNAAFQVSVHCVQLLQEPRSWQSKVFSEHPSGILSRGLLKCSLCDLLHTTLHSKYSESTEGSQVFLENRRGYKRFVLLYLILFSFTRFCKFKFSCCLD